MLLDRPSKIRKTSRKPKKKSIVIKTINPSDLRQKLASLTTVVFGIDMSLTNPGIAKIHPIHRTISLFYFRNRQKEHNSLTEITHPQSCFFGWNLQLTCIEEEKLQGPGSIKVCNRYLSKIMKILAVIGNNTHNNKIVGIEGYSFNSKMSSSFSTLMELGGCLRTALSLGQHRAVEITPTSVKKQFTGCGKVDKNGMYKAFQKTHYLPPLEKLIGIGDHEYCNTPHPIEDLVDAFAVALCTLVSL
jgi:Holliday junction resolvasome RuvABC endonuclease subunit